MGLYDRDYYREERRYVLSFGTPRPAVVTLIVINVLVAVFDAFTPKHGLSDLMAIHSGVGAWPDTLAHPWLWWQFLTYGFAHSPDKLGHLVFNMLGLWFFGNAVEEHYGRTRFTVLYATMLVVAGVSWAGIAMLTGGKSASLIGASGAVAGTVVLFALNFPHRTVLFMFLIPVRAWVIGVLAVAGDMLGALGWTRDTHVAYAVHLAGAAVAALYFYQAAGFGRLLRPLASLLGRARRRPRLRVYDEDEPAEPHEPDLAAAVDRILEKISREGEASLTRKERRTLEEASREYQRRRQR